MYLLPCPACQFAIPVSPSQAGDQTTCPACQQIVQIPKLGELRQLPLSEADDDAKIASNARPETSSGKRALFVLLGLIATASLLIAGFAAIRWALIDVPMSTEQHIAIYRQEYKKLKPAELIREYEQMEKYGLEMPMPYKYKTIELEKQDWGRNAAVAGTVGALSIIGLVLLTLTGPGTRDQTADT